MENLIVEEVIDNQINSAINHSFIGLLPIVFINKIDLENSLIKIRFILLNFNNINISFLEDKYNQVKIILPKKKFNFDDKVEEVNNIKGYKYKKMLVDFKFDESYKPELISNTSHILRFVVKAEFNRDGTESNSVSIIEYPIEIKFKIK